MSFPKYYKGYRIGSLEKEALKLLLGLKTAELPKRYKDDHTFGDIFKTLRQKKELPRVMQKLVDKKLIILASSGDTLVASLTKHGKQVTETFIVGDRTIPRPKRWDGKWRVVIFDIPEHRRALRNNLRYHLKRLGFAWVQGSVWLHPFPCDPIVALIKIYFSLGREVVYMVAEHIEGEYRFKKYFKL